MLRISRKENKNNSNSGAYGQETNVPALVRRSGAALLILLFGIILLSGIATAASGDDIFASLALNHTQTVKQLTVGTIESIDLMNLSQTEVILLSTKGDNSDIKSLASPNLRNVRRVFSSDSVQCAGNTLTVKSVDSQVDWSSWPGLNVYTSLKVPTAYCEIPGKTGNLVIAKINQSAQFSSVDSLFNSSDILYFASNQGLLAVKPRYNLFITAGIFPFDANNLVNTLNLNLIDLSSFTMDRQYSQELSNPWQMPLPFQENIPWSPSHMTRPARRSRAMRYGR